jgi:hypothetical protein
MRVSHWAVQSSFLCDAGEPIIDDYEVDASSGLEVVFSKRMDEVEKFFFIWLVFGGVCAKAWDPAAAVDDSIVVLRVVAYFFSVPVTT